MTLTNSLFSRRKDNGSASARLEATITEAWRWWIGELAACVPPALQQRFSRSRGRLLLMMDAPGENLFEVTPDGPRPLGRIDVNAPGGQQAIARLPRTRQAGQRPIAIRLGTRHALQTTASLPLAAERNLAQVIGFEFERLVPFKQSEVYFTSRVTTRDKAAQTVLLELTIVPHAALAELIAALSGLGFEATEIQVIDSAAEQPTTIILANEDRLAHGRNSRRANFSLGTIGIALAIACVAIPLWQDSAMLDSINAQIAEARRQADASATLQKQIQAESRDQNFLDDRKKKVPTVTELLATLTELLPDDSYLTDLEVNGDHIRMVGLTGSATSLLAAIARSPSFRDVAFESSITRDNKADRERFDISAQIAKRGGP